MSEDEEAPLSAVGVAYEFIRAAGDDWTREELLAVLARAGFPVDHEDELDGILEAVRQHLEYENILSKAAKMFLRENGFRDLRQAAEQMDCTDEEVIEMIAAKANLFGTVH